jgi:outer membrane protein assembly factor BamB
MSTAGESTKFVRPSRLYLSTLVFFWGVFGFFTVWQFLRKDSSAADPERLEELAKIPLAPEKRSGNDWPQWRGLGRDGLSAETGLLTLWPEGGPRKLWEQPTGGGFSSVAVARGRVFSMFQDQDQEAVVCWDAETGRELWRYRYPALFRHKFGDGPRSTPTVDGDLVFTVGATGIMTCLNLSGAKLWSKPLLEDFGAPNLEWGTSLSPLVDGNLVFVNPGGPGGNSLAALDKLTGAVRWQTLDDAASNSSPVLADSAGRRQLVFFTDRGLVAVTPDEGTFLWRYPWTTDFGANIATPIVAGDYVFLSSGYGKGCAMVKIEKTPQGLAPKLVYKNLKMKTHFSTCVCYQDHLYGFNDTTLTCMEFRTGKVTWTQRGFDKGSLTIADGHLFILGEFGTLAVAEATPEAFREQSRFQFSEKRCWTVLVIANGRLYVRDEQKLTCYDLKK